MIKIDPDAFRNCTTLKEITLPSSVTKIGGLTFHGCTSLEKITLPASVETIGWRAFDGCTSLEKITLPPSVENIGNQAFSGCYSLKEIRLPPSVEKIGKRAFSGCTALREICFPANTALNRTSFDGCGSLEKIRLSGAPGTSGKCLENLVLPQSVKSIEAPDVPYTSFSGKFQTLALIGFIEACMRGEAVKEKVKDANFEAIRKKKHLTQYLDYPLILRFLTQEKWIKLSQIDELTEASAKTGHVELTAMLMEYKHSAFSAEEIQGEELRKQQKNEKELERLLEPIDTSDPKYIKSMFRIEEKNGRLLASWYCGTDAEVAYPASVGGVKIRGIRDYGGKATGRFATGVEKVVLPEGYKRIGNYAFAGCTALKEIVLPTGLNKIGTSAFRGCTSLTKIIVPSGCTAIENEAFRECTALRKVIFPAGLKWLRLNDAFIDCTSLRELYIYSPDFDFRSIYSAYYSMPGNCAIYAPRDSKLAGDPRFKPLEDRLAELAEQGLTPEDDF